MIHAYGILYLVESSVPEACKSWIVQKGTEIATTPGRTSVKWDVLVTKRQGDFLANQDR